MTEELLGRYAGVMMNAFGTPQRVLVEGRGAVLRDADGKEYLDLLSGLAVTGLGHAHPAVTEAVSGQLDTLGHISNFFASPPQIRLAERLTGHLGSPGARVFFTNSGSEANETALKLTRLTGRRRIVAVEGAFHGRTTGALAVTHNAAYREPFEPLLPEVVFVPLGDVTALEHAVDDATAAVVVEPVQGENGVVPAPDGFLAAARRITEQRGALLWIDEVQTGVGRCGSIFAHRDAGIDADLVTLAKGLGNGFPIGACLASAGVAERLRPGMHGSTFGGNPVAAAAGNAVLDVIEPLLGEVVAKGDWLAAAIEGLGHPLVDHVRGRGLLRGIVLREPIAPEVAREALAAGFIINAPRPNVIRLAPPLIISEAQLGTFVEALPHLLERHV